MKLSCTPSAPLQGYALHPLRGWAWRFGLWAMGLCIMSPTLAQIQKPSGLSAKRGLGIRVVEGRRIAEQVLFVHRSAAVQVLSRSDDDVALLLDAQGGVREQAVEPGRAVLSDVLVSELARVGAQIKAVLGPAEQDIEWAVDGQGRIHVLQARPFVDRSMGGR